jgi:hypothetical protein
MTDYKGLDPAAAALALHEFLDERGPALERFRDSLVADGQDPDEVLDGTVESLRRVWPWVKSMLTGGGAGGGATTEPNAGNAPSWLRYSLGNIPELSPASISIVDGLISYVCQVVQQSAPAARWRVGHLPVGSYVWQNHPVLAVSDTGWALGEMVQRSTHPTGGRILSPDAELALRIAAVIDNLNQIPGDAAGDEPFIEVEDLGADPQRGRELELSLREDLAHRHTQVVDRMVRNLAKEDGITGVIREDREVVLVATATWQPARLHEWATRYLEHNIRD